MHIYPHTLQCYVLESGVHSVNITGMCLLMRKPLPSFPSPYQWACSGLCVIKTYPHCLQSTWLWTLMWNLFLERERKKLYATDTPAILGIHRNLHLVKMLCIFWENMKKRAKMACCPSLLDQGGWNTAMRQISALNHVLIESAVISALKKTLLFPLELSVVSVYDASLTLQPICWGQATDYLVRLSAIRASLVDSGHRGGAMIDVRACLGMDIIFKRSCTNLKVRNLIFRFFLRAHEKHMFLPMEANIKLLKREMQGHKNWLGAVFCFYSPVSNKITT